MPYSATTFKQYGKYLGNFYFHLTAKTNLSSFKVSEKKTTFNSMIIVVTVSNKQFFKNNNRFKWFFF